MLKTLTHEAWELYLKIEASKFTEKFLITQQIDKQNRVEDKAYTRYKRRFDALEHTTLSQHSER
jgi:hypothetical protein